MPFVFDHDGAFWSKVDRSDGDDACWVWLRAVDTSGYGVLKVWGRKVSAHRYSYELAYTSIPQGMLICHRCNNRLCVNPRHLYVCTSHQNVQDAIEAGTFSYAPGKGSKPGEQNPSARLSADEVLNIYRRAWAGESSRKIAAMYGVSHKVVYHIKFGKKWSSVTGHKHEQE
jgi:hypothetical protein